jgi:acetyl esterase/lipase
MFFGGVTMRRVVAIAFGLLLVTAHASGGEQPFARVADVPYLGDTDKSAYAQEKCRLDVFYPKGMTGYPTLVWFHGGGLTGGNRKSGEALARRFTAAGVAVVLVGYRLSPRVKNPVWTEDAAAAVAWTVHNIGKYKGDPNKVFIAGHSAGGYLTAMVGLDEKYLGKHAVPPVKIAGLIPIAGQMVTHATIRKANGKSKPYIDEFAPIHHVRADSPPWLVIVGDKDSTDRIKESADFVAAMKKAGSKNVALEIVPDRNHGSIVARIAQSDDVVAELMLKFIKKGAP